MSATRAEYAALLAEVPQQGHRRSTGGALAKHIAAALGWSPWKVGRMLKELQRRGLVQQRPTWGADGWTPIGDETAATYEWVVA